MRKKSKSNATAATSRLQDLNQGVIVVLSGGPFDWWNPSEVLGRMEQLILDVNADPYVVKNTGGQGLKFKILPDQEWNHIHQSRWRDVCAALKDLPATPLILIGHSNGGAAVVDIANCLLSEGKIVDFAFTADSVLTLDDNGDVNQVPSNVKLNLNPYTIPVFPEYLEFPFPIGTKNKRAGDRSLNGILNIGLPFKEGGAFAHRDVFYDVAGGAFRLLGGYQYPEIIRDTVLAFLQGASNEQVMGLAQQELQMLADEVRIDIEIETSGFGTTLTPSGTFDPRTTARMPESMSHELSQLMNQFERVRLESIRHITVLSKRV